MLRSLCVLLSFGVAVWAPPVIACTCVDPLPRTLPADDAVDVPTNQKIWIATAQSPLFFALLTSDGAVVDTIGTPWDRSGVLLMVLAPVAALAPASTFEVHQYDEPVSDLIASDPARLLQEGDVRLTFTTGDEPDHEPPAPPLARVTGVFSARVDGSGSCDPVDGYTAGVSFRVDHEGDFFVSVRGTSAPMSLAEVAGAANALDNVFFGNGSCTRGWRDASPGATASFLFAAVDGAGNVSEWSRPIEVTLPELPPEEPEPESEPHGARSGCAAGEGASGLPILLGALVLRRRRAARRGRETRTQCG